MNANSQNSLRRAAVLLGALDTELATSVVARLPANHAALVRQVLDTLGPVSADEQDRSIVEFLRVSPAPVPPTLQRDGVELSLESTTAVGPIPAAEARAQIANRPVNDATSGYGPSDFKPTASSPFHFRDEQDIMALAEMLQHERPQTVAVCLSQLTEQQLGQVVALLPDDLRHEALERIPRLAQLDSLVIDAILAHLHGWVRDYQSRRGEPPTSAAVRSKSPTSPSSSRVASYQGAGPERLTGRDSQDRETAKSAPEDYAPRDSSPLAATPSATLAQPPGPNTPAASPQTSAPPCQFHDLARLEPHELMAVLREVGPDAVVLALAASEPVMFQAVAQLLPTAEVEKLQQEVANLGPTAIRDVDRAQQMMADAATRLGFTP